MFTCPDCLEWYTLFAIFLVTTMILSAVTTGTSIYICVQRSRLKSEPCRQLPHDKSAGSSILARKGISERNFHCSSIEPQGIEIMGSIISVCPISYYVVTYSKSHWCRMQDGDVTMFVYPFTRYTYITGLPWQPQHLSKTWGTELQPNSGTCIYMHSL